MQTELFTKVIPVVPQIEFDCTVGGKELTATITDMEDSRLHRLVHVHFSDGHKGVYFSNDVNDQTFIGLHRKRDPYKEAILADLSVIGGLEDRKPYFCIRLHEKGAESFNVWAWLNESGVYDVSYKGEYQFSLRKTDKWEMSTRREKNYAINQEIAAIVCKNIDEASR